MNEPNTYYLSMMDRYFSGDLDASELEALNEWVKSSDANRSMFDERNKIWALINHQMVEETVEVEKEWGTFQKNISSSGNTQNIDLHPKQKNFFNVFSRIAAAIVFIIMSVTLINYLINRPHTETIKAKQQIVESSLPDGSNITLNKGSSLSYESGFNDIKRAVALSGNAYFDVAPDSSRPFLISISQLVVEVVGTSFFVNEIDDKIEVIVNSGKVKVYFLEDPDHAIILTEGERALSDPDQQEIKKQESIQDNNMAWKTRKIAFHDESMKNVVKTISQIYQTDITITNLDINNCRITASFDHQSIESVLNVLKATLDIQIEQSGKKIKISGDGCKE